MRMLSRPWVSSLLLAVCSMGLAQNAGAGRPFSTEDAGVLDPSACEWENVAERSRRPGEARLSAASTQIGCGLGLRSQLAVNLGQLRGVERVSVLGLGGKTGLWEADGGALTLAWTSSWSKARSGPREWDGLMAQLVYSKELEGGWNLHANLGRSYNRPERRSVSTWGLLAERQLSEDWDLGAELFAEGSQRPGLGLGTRWRPLEGWTLDASLGRGSHHRGEARERYFTLGFKLEF